MFQIPRKLMEAGGSWWKFVGNWWKLVEVGGSWWKLKEVGGSWWKIGGSWWQLVAVWWKMVAVGGSWWKFVEITEAFMKIDYRYFRGSFHGTKTNSVEAVQCPVCPQKQTKACISDQET